MRRSSHSNSTTFELRTFSADSKFVEFFSRTRRWIRTSGLYNRHHLRNNQLNKCALPNRLKGPKIILDMADRHVSKDGPFRWQSQTECRCVLPYTCHALLVFFLLLYRHLHCVPKNVHLFIFQITLSTLWANVRAIDVKFSPALTHQKSSKSVNFWQSYFKNKKVDVSCISSQAHFVRSDHSVLRQVVLVSLAD